MKSWHILIVTCLLIQALGIYGSLVVMDSIQSDLSDIYDIYVHNQD